MLSILLAASLEPSQESHGYLCGYNCLEGRIMEEGHFPVTLIETFRQLFKITLLQPLHISLTYQRLTLISTHQHRLQHYFTCMLPKTFLPKQICIMNHVHYKYKQILQRQQTLFPSRMFFLISRGVRLMHLVEQESEGERYSFSDLFLHSRVIALILGGPVSRHY